MDHPATQEIKKERWARANFEAPNGLHFVPMDFTGGFSYSNLVDKGFVCHHKTCCSLLGVSYYLTKEEISGLIDRLFSLLPPGSSIVMDYADEQLFTEKGLFNRVENMVNMAAASGEPMKSCFTYEEMESMLDQSGLLIYEHLTPAGINERFFRQRNDDLSAFETIHYIHAVKR